MSITQALLWKEWRSIRTETLVLAGFMAAWTITFCAVSAVTGRETWLDANVLGLCWFGLPCAALLLGASTTAGDAGLAFAVARPASRVTQVMARIGARLAAVAFITLLPLGILVAASSGVLSRLASQLDGAPAIAWSLVSLAAFLVGCFSAACLMSAHAERPLAAVFTGGAGVALLLAVGRWGLGEIGDDPQVLGSVLSGAAAVLLLLAAMATARRMGAPLPVRGLVRSLAMALAGGAVVAAAWPLGMSVAIDIAGRSVERELRAVMPSGAEALEGRALRVQPNESHARVVAAASSLGYDMNRARWIARPVWLDGSDARWEVAQRSSASTLVDAPPAAVIAWADANQGGIEAVRDALRSEELPRWREGNAVDGWWEPEATGYMQLSRMLRVHSLVALSRGPALEHEVLQDLDASWRIGEALSARGQLSAELFALAIAGRVTLLLPKLSAVPEGWDERLDIAAWREGLTRGLLREATWSLSHARERVEPSWTRWSPVERLLLKPMLGWSHLRDARRRLEGASLVIASARRDGAVVARGPELDRWSRQPQVMLDRLEAQMELARATFAVRRARAADPSGAWPTAVPGVGPSALEGLHWVYTPGDVPTLHAEGPVVPWVEQHDAPGPRRLLRVELH